MPLGTATDSSDRHGAAAAGDAPERTTAVALPSAQAHFRLAAALAGLKQSAAAIHHYRQALRLDPDFAEAQQHLSHLFIQLERWDEAATALQEFLRLRPGDAESYYRLGWTQTELGRLREAGDCFQQAVRLRPDYAQAHWALAYNWLLRGDLEPAWPKAEWRCQARHAAGLGLPQPRWDGSPLAGRTILLRSEQGLGDMIQFVRYAALVKAQGGTVIVECARALLPLFRSVRGIDALVPIGSPLPAFDVYAPFMSLPGIFQTSLATLPAEVPYLGVDAKLQAHWQRRLSHLPGLKVGIAWQGNPGHPNDRQRSIPLRHFAVLAQVPDVCLVSLQRGPGTEQRQALADPFPLHEFPSWLDDTGRAFLVTPALVKNLDLVIAPDTSLAHLAGALGVPIWVALPFMPDWRWMLEREDSPWYPTMRLFRQKRRGDWDDVFQRLRLALAERAAEIR